MSTPHPIIEIVEDQLTSAEPTEEEVLAHYGTQIDDMVDHFWRQTHQLAVEHAVLANRQNHQAQQQQAALMAVQTTTQNHVELLAVRQEWTAVNIERALMDTRNALQQQLMSVAHAQHEHEEEFQDEVRSQIETIIASAQNEAIATHGAISSQAAHMMELEHRVEQLVTGMHADLTSRLSSVSASALGPANAVAAEIRCAWNAMETEIRGHLDQLRDGLVNECVAATEKRFGTERPTRQRTKLLIERSVGEMEERVERNLQQAFQAAREGDRQREEEMKRAAIDASEEADARLESRLRDAMKQAQVDLRGEISSQKDALAALESRVRQSCESLSVRISALENGRPTVPARLGAAPLGAAPLGAAPVGAVPVGAAPLGDAPLGDAALGAAALGDAPLGDAPLPPPHPQIEIRLVEQERRMVEVERKLQSQIKQVIFRRKRPNAGPTRKAKVTIAAAAAQRDIEGRAELAARYYDLRWRARQEQDVVMEDGVAEE